MQILNVQVNPTAPAQSFEPKLNYGFYLQTRDDKSLAKNGQDGFSALVNGLLDEDVDMIVAAYYHSFAWLGRSQPSVTAVEAALENVMFNDEKATEEAFDDILKSLQTNDFLAEVESVYQEQRQAYGNHEEAYRINDRRRSERSNGDWYASNQRLNNEASTVDDPSRIIAEARRIGLTPTELKELTPKEFKAVQRGYQLHLVDQRDLTLFAKTVPQQTVPIEPQQSIADLIKQLQERNQAIGKGIAEGRDEQPQVPKKTIASQLLMEMLGGG